MQLTTFGSLRREESFSTTPKKASTKLVVQAVVTGDEEA